MENTKQKALQCISYLIQNVDSQYFSYLQETTLIQLYALFYVESGTIKLFKIKKTTIEYIL